MAYKILLYTIIALLIITLAIALFTPSFLSTDWGNRFLLEKVNERIAGNIQAQDIKITWLGPQRAKNVVLKNKEGITLLSLDQINIQEPLWKLILNRHQLSSLDINNLNATIPTNTLDRFIAHPDPRFQGLMSQALGPTLHLTVQQTDKNIHLQIKSSKLNGDLFAHFANDHFNLTQNSQLLLSIEPDMVHRFSPIWQLLNPSQANLQINKLSFNYSSLNPKTLVVDASLDLPKFVLKNQTDANQFTIDFLHADLQALENSEEATLRVNSTGFQKNTQQPIHLKLDWSIERSDKWTTLFDSFKNRSKFKADVVSLPISLIEQLLDFQQSLKETIGTSASFQINGQAKQGQLHLVASIASDKTKIHNAQLNAKIDDLPFSGNLTAEKVQLPKLALNQVSFNWLAHFQDNKGDFKIDFHAGKDQVSASGLIQKKVLYLTEPLIAEITILPEHEPFISHYFPLFKGLVKSSAPITLKIEPKGFFVNYQNWLDTLRIGKGVLQVGQIWFTPESQLAQIASTFKVSSTIDFPAAFTPLFFNFNQGTLNISRVDMLLLENYPIASWGSVNFLKDQVDMTVGLTSRTLSKALGIHGVPEDKLLQMPFTGTISKARLDKQKLAAHLAALVAQTQVSKKGQLFGALVEIASGSIFEPTPLPTTQPLPWPIASEEEPSDSSVIDEPSQALKGLETKAGNILKTFLSR